MSNSWKRFGLNKNIKFMQKSNILFLDFFTKAIKGLTNSNNNNNNQKKKKERKTTGIKKNVLLKLHLIKISIDCDFADKCFEEQLRS